MNDRKAILGVLIMIALATTLSVTPVLLQVHSAKAYPILAVINKSGKAPMATSGGNLYVTWWTNKPVNSEVMFKASKDGGQTFGKKINLSNSPGYSSDAAVAASGNNVHVAWLENGTTGPWCNLVTRTSTDNGQTFGPIISLWPANETADIPQPTLNALKTLPINESGEVHIAAEGNNVYIVAKGAEHNPSHLYTHEVYMYTSNDNGKTFGKDINLSNSPGIDSNRTELSASGNNVYVTWWEKLPNAMDQPLMKISKDNGHTFGETIKLSANATSPAK